ncbi:MAG TPA: MFS transporter [Elusimicrobiales bacterium]|nr:MFS transporter [Elusimicrobiales bacterium]
MTAQTLPHNGRAQAGGLKTFAVFMVGFCAFLALYATQPLLPLFHKSFNASKLAVSLTVSAATLAVALSAPFVGILADLRGRKKVIIPAIYLLAAVNLLTATSPGLKALIFWRFAQGLLTPAVFAVAVAYINEEWAACEAGFVTSVYVTGTVVGGFCGRFISGFVAARWSWPWVFVCIGLLNLLLAFLISSWLPPAKQFKKVAGYGAGLRNMAGHLRNKRLLGIYAVGFTILFSLVGTFTYITFYLAEPPFGLGPALLGGIFSVYLVGAVITPLAGRWSNRVPGWKMLSCALLVSMCGVLLTLFHSLPLVIAGITLCSSGVFVCQIVTNRSIGPAAGRSRASAVGLYVSFYYCGGFVGSVVPGFLWELGGWPCCALFISAVLLLSALFTLRVWPGLEPARGSPICDALEVVN